MARIRTIKPEFWRHEDLSALPEATHLLAAALLNYCDDCGYFNANPKLIQAETSPLREPSVSIPESLRSLQTVGYICLGTDADRQYGRVVHFSDHQRVSHPTPSKIQALSIAWENSGEIPEGSAIAPDNFRPEGNREQGTGKGIAREARSSPQKITHLADLEIDEDISAWSAKEAPDVDVALEFGKFLEHCRANGSSSGDYRAGLRKWLLKGQEFAERDGRAAPKTEPIPDERRWPLVRENLRRKCIRNPVTFRNLIEPQEAVSFAPLVLRGPAMPDDIQDAVRYWWDAEVVFEAMEHEGS